MTTTADLIESTRRHLFTGQAEQLNKLASAIVAGDTTISVTYDLGGIQPGAIIAIDLEEIYVFAVNAGTKQISDCARGYNGTTAASHSDDAIITVRPKFSNFRILQAINDDLSDLSTPVNGLYQLRAIDITFNPSRYGYDITDSEGIVSIAEVRFRTAGPERTWPRIDMFTLERNMPTSGSYGDFASGNALVLYQGAQPGYPIRVKYWAPFAPLAELDDDVQEAAGLAATMLDIPPLGAAIRLLAGREVKRNFDEAQSEPRRADEVPPQAQTQAPQALRQLRRERVQAEAARIIREYGQVLVGV